MGFAFQITQKLENAITLRSGGVNWSAIASFSVTATTERSP
jgi:hypothetical protein